MNTQKTYKRIGIITYHRAINYGAVLQAYALQKKIKELGAECVILDYRNQKLENKHKKKGFFDCKKIKDFANYLLLAKNHNTKYDKFRKFAKNYLEISEPLYSLNDLKAIEEKYDRFITGSDQVWNYKINDMDVAYFLDFTKEKSKKATYAASFGISSIPNEYRQRYYNLLRDFDNILIREKQGVDIIRELLCKEAKVVLDPTLLVSKEEWYSLAKGNQFNRKKYILVYAFGGSKYIMDLAKNISKQTGYQIICISNTYKKSINTKYVKSAGPEEFLGLFKNAEYIVTNSFHGTAFSINFNKQFFTELLPESHGTNSRLQDILDLFDLRHRQILSSNINISDTQIDYSKVNKILTTERKKSLSYLERIVCC